MCDHGGVVARSVEQQCCLIGWLAGYLDGWMDGHEDVPALHCGLSIAAPAPQEEEPSPKPVLGELRAPHVTSDSVQLEWSVPEGTFDSFTLQYRDAQGQPQVLPVDGGSRTLTVPGLSPSRRYKFNLYGLWGRTRLGPVSTDTVTGEGALAPAMAPLGTGLAAGQELGQGPGLGGK